MGVARPFPHVLMRPASALLALILLLASAASSAQDAAEGEYQAARKAYYSLKEDPDRRKLRHHWQNVAGRFEAVAKRHPNSRRTPDALFTAAELQRELSRISFLEEDLREAIGNYQRLIDEHPKSNLSDDAALALARIYLERTSEPQRARQVLEHALGTLPKGDMHRELTALRASLPQVPAPPPTGKRVAASDAAPAPSKIEPVAPRAPGRIVAQAPAAKVEPAAPRAPGRIVAQAPASAGAEPAASGRPQLLAAIAKVARAPEGFASADLTLPPPAPEVAGKLAPQLAATPGIRAEPKLTTPSALAAAPAESAPTSASAESALASASAAEPEPSAAPKSLSREAKKRLGAAVGGKDMELTLAEQLGLKVRRVVIDAGHGGHDSGAVGAKGTKEKDVTLALAKRVGKILSDAGLEVILTRDDDTFVRLEDRTRIANEAKGDLFISIHCNAAPSRKVRGTETFTLNVASDRYSIRLAARENASSEKSMSDLQFILADLATKANTEESERLATRVQGALVGKLSEKHPGVKDLGTKQALFYVLLGAKMPAILVETAFLSHPEEEARLASPAYQEDTAQAIAQGVQDFLSDRQRLAQIR